MDKFKTEVTDDLINFFPDVLKDIIVSYSIFGTPLCSYFIKSYTVEEIREINKNNYSNIEKSVKNSERILYIKSLKIDTLCFYLNILIEEQYELFLFVLRAIDTERFQNLVYPSFRSVFPCEKLLLLLANNNAIYRDNIQYLGYSTVKVIDYFITHEPNLSKNYFVESAIEYGTLEVIKYLSMNKQNINIKNESYSVIKKIYKLGKFIDPKKRENINYLIERYDLSF